MQAPPLLKNNTDVVITQIYICSHTDIRAFCFFIVYLRQEHEQALFMLTSKCEYV